MGDRRVDVVAPVGVISSDPSHFAHADRSPGRVLPAEKISR